MLAVTVHERVSMTGELQACFYHMQKSKGFVCPAGIVIPMQDAELTAKAKKFFIQENHFH